MRRHGFSAICAMHVLMLSLICSFSTAHAGEVTLPTTFVSGTPAVAAEVNANFGAVKTAVDDNDSRIAALEAIIVTLQNRLAAVEGSPVMALEDYLDVDDESDPRGTMIRITGANVRIDNGAGSTDTINGLGNLIIGYDEINELEGFQWCSDGSYYVEADCVAAGATWSFSHKNGSHNLVLGRENSYSQYGGLVAGRRNVITYAYSTITGGYQSSAQGEYSHVSGGSYNRAYGRYSSVVGGVSSTASGENSSVSGGYSGRATGDHSSISGGAANTASGEFASVTGGIDNEASGYASSVSGGRENTASGNFSSVSGGNGAEATLQYSWAAGTLLE